ncbi:hypothetical protein TNCV_843471 [Trichonephila clavipes]|nr:hypothetical protein TNCV_843471 [Trichonephila clavipes]
MGPLYLNSHDRILGDSSQWRNVHPRITGTGRILRGLKPDGRQVLKALRLARCRIVGSSSNVELVPCPIAYGRVAFESNVNRQLINLY